MDKEKKENLSKEEVMAIILETNSHDELKTALLNQFHLKEKKRSE